jgi:serine O-acetyltransferase
MCNISQGVTLGVAGQGLTRGAPTLGDRVCVGANAVVAGKISVGDDAAIAANSLVIQNVPPRAVVVGVPARSVSNAGSAHLLHPFS